MSALPVQRLALGTAQLGLPYGIANRTGQPNATDAAEIVAASWHGGVRYFDTAQAYGESERMLAAALSRGGFGRGARIVTKLHPRIDVRSPEAIRAAVLASCRALGRHRLWALLLHAEDHLDHWSDNLGKTLCALRDEGRIAHLGVSLYNVQRTLQALEFPDLTVFQVPANVFDRRMHRAGIFERAHALGKMIFVRSLYLQGLVFLAPTELPPRLAYAAPALHAYREFCQDRRFDFRTFAMGYARARAPHARFVLGAETAAQAAENAETFRTTRVKARDCDEWDACWSEDADRLINPSLWPDA